MAEKGERASDQARETIQRESPSPQAAVWEALTGCGGGRVSAFRSSFWLGFTLVSFSLLP